MASGVASISDFLDWFKEESNGTSKVLGGITDKALAQEVASGHRNLGRVAWHIVTTYPDMAGKMGIKTEAPSETEPIPKSASDIKAAYDKAAAELLEFVEANWSDGMLNDELEMYGVKFSRGKWLRSFVIHEAHHRGQMTVLMRQAGLEVPGVYGPSRDEWKAYGMETPAL